MSRSGGAVVLSGVLGAAAGGTRHRRTWRRWTWSTGVGCAGDKTAGLGHWPETPLGDGREPVERTGFGRYGRDVRTRMVEVVWVAGGLVQVRIQGPRAAGMAGLMGFG